jgi:hypothetical protein
MRRVQAVAIALGTFGLVVAQTAAQDRGPSATAPADAAELKLITTVCGSCHTSRSILGTHRTTTEWEEVLDWMSDEGAVMNDDEFERLRRFLSVRYGRVKVNIAPAEELRLVLELSGDQAGKIVAARTGARRFTTIEELASAAGVPVGLLEARRSRVDFGSD